MHREFHPAEALVRVRELVESLGDQKALHSFYIEYGRRLLVLRTVKEFCPQGSTVLDLGASPFIVSCALAYMGYDVVAVDYDPGKYLAIASRCGVKVIRADLERDRLELPAASAGCAVFTEVLEHLSPYYVGSTLSEVNRVLRDRGRLVLTTPNIASLFRRLRLLLGAQPQYAIHVREYTKREVEGLLERYGFRVVRSWFSEVNDLTFVNAEPSEYLRLTSYWSLLRLAVRRPTWLNVLRALAYPVVKTFPSLRMLIVAVAEKIGEAVPETAVRW